MGESFVGKVNAPAGEVRTWQELLFAAIDQRTYTAGAGAPEVALNAKQRRQMKDRFRAATGYIRRFKPAANVFLLNAYKGNVNGTVTQAAWTLPGDVTGATTGAGAEYDGGVEYRPMQQIGMASDAVYAAAATLIDVEITVE